MTKITKELNELAQKMTGTNPHATTDSKAMDYIEQNYTGGGSGSTNDYLIDLGELTLTVDENASYYRASGNGNLDNENKTKIQEAIEKMNGKEIVNIYLVANLKIVRGEETDYEDFIYTKNYSYTQFEGKIYFNNLTYDDILYYDDEPEAISCTNIDINWDDNENYYWGASITKDA